MLTGPSVGLKASICVSGAATAFAAASIFAVIEAVVFGLTMRMRMMAYTPLPASDPWRRRRRCNARDPSRQTSTMVSENPVVSVPSA